MRLVARGQQVESGQPADVDPADKRNLGMTQNLLPLICSYTSA